MNKDLYHEAVAIVTKDGNDVCTLHSPYFKKEDVVKIFRELFQYSENFIIIGYQTGERERKLKEAVDFYKKHEKKRKSKK